MSRIKDSDVLPPDAIPVLDHGFVSLETSMGNDLTIVNAARVSYGKRAGEFAEGDARLLSFLAEHKHMSPFRHGMLQFHVKAPEFVMRQWYKHVVGCEWTSGEGRFVDHGWNEISGRYAEYDPEFYIPEFLRPQSPDNKQASEDGNLNDALVQITPKSHTRPLTASAKDWYASALSQAYGIYKGLLAAGVAKEQARCVLPVCFYTEVYWTISLQGAAHFVKLRDHAGAQHEIQAFARAIEELARQCFPVSFEALMQHL